MIYFRKYYDGLNIHIATSAASFFGMPPGGTCPRGGSTAGLATLNNIKEVYPEGYFVELHFKEFDQKYSGMDWESLKLVFQQENGEWYLVAIIHDQWTI